METRAEDNGRRKVDGVCDDKRLLLMYHHFRPDLRRQGDSLIYRIKDYSNYSAPNFVVFAIQHEVARLY